MKQSVKWLLTAIASVIMAVSYAAFTYDPAAGTLTDGVWTLPATLKTNTDDKLEIDCKLGVFIGESDKTYPIDLTEIRDAGGKRYYAVKFSNFTCNKNNPSSYKLQASVNRLSAFIAPDCTALGGNGCFYGCSSLTKVVLADGFTTFCDRSFVNCSALVDFYPLELQNVKSINIGSFSGCKSLPGGFSFPQCTDLGDATFDGCEKLDDIEFPKLKKVNKTSFQSCSNLKKLKLAEGVHRIGSSAFSGCTSLTGEFFREILTTDIEYLGDGNVESEYKNVFRGCTSFDGDLVWDFPNLFTNIVGYSLFANCSKLSRVVFKTPVAEIRNEAFCEMASGAELYMHSKPPAVFGNKIGNAKGPFLKMILKDNYDAWLEKISEKYHIIRKEDFNNKDITIEGRIWKWKDVAGKMSTDDKMCSVEGEKVSLREKRVLAFALGNENNTIGVVKSFWILHEPLKGLKVIVK